MSIGIVRASDDSCNNATLRPGGLLIVDNMLWGGRIFDAADRSAATEGVRALTRALASRPSWISSLMPIRDGMIVALWQPGS